MRYDYGFLLKSNVWLELWFKVLAATKSMTNKGSEKPRLPKWGGYRHVVLKSSGRKWCLTFMSISNKAWLWFSPQKAMFDWSSVSYYREQPNPLPTRVQRSPDWPDEETTGRWCWRAQRGSCAGHSFPFLMRYDYVSSKGNVWLKLCFRLQAATKSMASKGLEKPWLAIWGNYRQVVLKSSAKLYPTFMSISNEVWLCLLKRQCLIEALIQTTGCNQIHDQRGFTEALTGQMRELQAGGVEEFMEEVVLDIHFHI